VTDPLAEVIELHEGADASVVVPQLLDPTGGDHVLVRRPDIVVGEEVLALLVRACEAANAATSSPVPSTSAPRNAVVQVGLHERLPPPASMALPCPDAMVLSREAVRSLPFIDVVADRHASATLLDICRRLVDTGWRHVTAPGTAFDWKPGDLDRQAAGGRRNLAAALAGPANEGLTTQTLWTDYSLRSPRIIVDGACLTDAPNNGSQKLVVNVTRRLKLVRPAASVTLAVDAQFVDYFENNLAGVDVVERTRLAEPFDLVYRPYQLIDPAELPWLAHAGKRMLLGQLDMIAFSNPSYHPSQGLFHAVRNLQRRVLRLADGVVFISEFGRQITHAECPDLDQARTFVVSCGTESDVPAETDGLASKAPLELPDEYVLCLSATFSHKNRPHALRVFEQLCEHHGFAGSLVIAGPEPFYGRSTEAERRLIDGMPASVRARIIRMGRIDERTKWCLLRSARLVLYPSVVEGFGLVPFEAAAVGTPSYGYSGSGLRELLDAAPCLISTWRVNEWAQAAHNAITDQQCASEIVAAINRAAQLHTWDRVATLTWDAIDATVASPHANARHEEGGWDSRIAPTDRTLGAGARTTHLAHRAIAIVDRRLHGVAHGESEGEAEARDPST
jgi:glycosyltransferase involved in cell wall biosynthesis